MKFKIPSTIFVILLSVYLIAATCWSSEPQVFGRVNQESPLTAPTLSLAISGTTLSLTWSPVAGATGYRLYYAPYPYSGPESIRNIDMGTKTSMSATLWDGATFYVAVKAYNTSGSSTYSNIEHFTIWSSLSTQLGKLPEVYTNSVNKQIIEQYKQLLIRLPVNGMKWITGMGWGLEDLVLDSNEIALLRCLASKNTSSVLSILTNPKIIDGVTSSDVSWAQGYSVESLQSSLKQDIDELETKGLISAAGVAGITKLIGMAGSNFEIAKGLYLIGNFGHPNSELFSYSVPAYNTQLYILGELAELGIPEGYEVAAVAAALDYGTLWSIADNSLRAIIVEYASDIILYQSQTDEILPKYGVSTQAKDLPLEAQIALVWGAPGNYYPITKEEGLSSVFSWRGYREIFTIRKMSVSDFEFVFTKIETLAEMKQYVLTHNLFNSDAEIFSSKISKFWYGDHLIYSWTPEIIDVDGRKIYNGYICNMDWQWDKFQTTGNFIGGSGDAYIHTFFLKSLNSPGITITYLVHISGHYDPSFGAWKADSYEFTLDNYNKEDTRLGWNKVPYDNFWNNPLVGNESGRIRFLTPLRAYTVWSNGVPKGYIFRSDVSSEPYPPI